MFIIGQKVIIRHLAFAGVTGVIVDKKLYYRVKFDCKAHGYCDAVFKENELELIEPKNIMEYLKHKLIRDM